MTIFPYPRPSSRPTQRKQPLMGSGIVRLSIRSVRDVMAGSLPLRNLCKRYSYSGNVGNTHEPPPRSGGRDALSHAEGGAVVYVEPPREARPSAPRRACGGGSGPPPHAG